MVKFDYDFVQVLFGLTQFFPKMVYANLIGSLNSYYKKLSIWLNNKGLFFYFFKFLIRNIFIKKSNFYQKIIVKHQHMKII